MVTESLLWLASLVGLPHWLLGTVDMLNNPLVSKIVDYFVGLAVEAFFSRLWRVVRPLFSRGWESFKAWFKGLSASASTSTTTSAASTNCAASTSCAAPTSAASSVTCAARPAETTTPPLRSCGRSADPVALVALPSRGGARVVAGLMR